MVFYRRHDCRNRYFHEVYKYSRNFNLNLKFIVEDNMLSTNTPTHTVWNKKRYFEHKNIQIYFIVIKISIRIMVLESVLF